LKNIWFVYFDSPWFLRGWHYPVGIGAGVNAFQYARGHENDEGSFRVDITMSKYREKSFLE